MRLDVRRLAAVDLYGAAGARPRRRLVLLEFVVAAVGCTALGLLLLGGVPSAGRILLGGALLGIGVNYVTLTAHAVALCRPGALTRELAGVDVAREARYYCVAQLWLAVPLLLLGLTLRPGRPAAAPHGANRPPG